MKRRLALLLVICATLGACARHCRFRGWLGCALIDAGSHILPEPDDHDVRFARSVADYCVRESMQRTRQHAYDSRWMP